MFINNNNQYFSPFTTDHLQISTVWNDTGVTKHEIIQQIVFSLLLVVWHEFRNLDLRAAAEAAKAEP